MSEREVEHNVVMVGVDGSPASRGALRWAVRQAEAVSGRVVAVLAWQEPTGFGLGVTVPPGIQWGEEARVSLHSTVASALGERVPVPIEQRVVEGHPAEVLLSQSKDADLLVVGSRGLGGFVGTLLGSVSRQIVSHATCPVVVIPDKP
jgi:nucleotide-binding universal stress UspA family protein